MLGFPGTSRIESKKVIIRSRRWTVSSALISDVFFIGGLTSSGGFGFSAAVFAGGTKRALKLLIRI